MIISIKNIGTTNMAKPTINRKSANVNFIIPLLLLAFESDSCDHRLPTFCFQRFYCRKSFNPSFLKTKSITHKVFVQILYQIIVHTTTKTVYGCRNRINAISSFRFIQHNIFVCIGSSNSVTNRPFK